MIYSPQLRPRKRAPRVSLRGTIPATVQLENGRHLPANLRQISMAGGVLELAVCLDERANVRLTLPFSYGTVYPKAQMLFPMRGAREYLQPFRFTGMREEESTILEREITELLKQAVAPATESQGFRPPRFYLESF